LANIKAAQKAIRSSQKRAEANRSYKTSVKTSCKKAEVAALKNDENAAVLLKMAQSSLQKAAGKDIIKKQTASRKISRLTKKLNTAAAKASAPPAA
jgi:small subunit ribosomal protein S20